MAITIYVMSRYVIRYNSLLYKSKTEERIDES